MSSQSSLLPSHHVGHHQEGYYQDKVNGERVYRPYKPVSAYLQHMNESVALPQALPSSPAPLPPPPPPTVPKKTQTAASSKTKRALPQPLDDMPPLPPIPKAYAVSLRVPQSKPVIVNEKPSGLRSPQVAEQATLKRETILSRIEGWWDLGLLERRATMMFKNGNALGLWNLRREK